MHEIAVGSLEEATLCASYIGNLRSIGFKSVFKFLEIKDLNEIVESERGSLDLVLFFECVESICEFLRLNYCSDFRPLPFARWGCVSPKEKERGGFLSRRSWGYLDHYAFGLAVLPNTNFYRQDISTLEIIRAYIHDSIHAFCFRSYRISKADYVQTPKQYLPRVNRYQYGPNFRSTLAIPFSHRKDAILQVGQINLNRLMDGVAVILQSQGTKEFLIKARPSMINQDHPLFRDILGVQAFGERGYNFLAETAYPVKEFQKFWGIESEMEPIYTAMTSGSIGPGKALFALKANNAGAWDQIFRNNTEEFIFEHSDDEVSIPLPSIYDPL